MNDEFSEVFDLYKDDIYRLAYSYVLNIHDAEDILQNVFIKLYKHIDIIDSTYLKKWLITVTINEAKNFLISNWIKKVFKASEEINNFKDNQTNDNNIFEELKRVPKKYRVLLHLYYFEGYSVKEIAAILNKNENTIKTQLRRAKEKLKIEVEK